MAARVSACGSSSKMDLTVFQGIMIALFVASSIAKPEDPSKTYDLMYQQGVDAYNSGKWFECAENMHRALDDFKMYRNVLIDCRLNCSKQSKTDIDMDEYTDLAFFDLILRRSDCVRRCKKEHLGDRPEVFVAKIEEDFKSLEPYHYLQLCAYKIGEFQLAASSAYTYMLAHPDHPQMKNNMVYYRTMPEVKDEFFVDLEAKDYQVKYQEGVEAYNEENYKEVIVAMEEALLLYYNESRRCNALCEGPYDHESLPDHVNAIADHYIHVLECQVDCPSQLATFMAKEVENFLPEQYNYLQFSYYKVGQLNKAIEAAATYLLFDPTNKEMLGNRDFFMKEEGVTDDWFIIREDAKAYHERRKLELKQLNFIKNSYMFSNADLGKQGPNRKRKVQKYDTSFTPLRFGPRDEKHNKTMAKHYETGINLALTDKELHGKHRVVLDNFITNEEAEKLVNLAGMATEGDGYSASGRPSPHTDYEKFEGMTIMKAALLAQYGVVSDDLSKLYLSISEKMRAFLEDYWNLVTPLYFHFTHLVCRTALEDQKSRKDLSHPVHSDNCHIRADGSCPKVPPAYVQRDVSAILYLNDGFEGGNFFFAHKNLSVQQIVEPKTSRMVAFEAGDFHGVQAVTKGRRCALAIWFTMSELDAEVAHREASAILRHKEVFQSITNPSLRSMLEEQDIRIVKTETELNGPERFAADHLVTKSECEKLIKLANAGGVQGDGYRASGRGKSQSPHTTHEMFEGLSLIRATQLAAEKKVDLDAVELYLNVAERGRELVEIYFNLKTRLYFDFTHLVCRTALHNDNTERTDLSHPVHSDNCILQPDGTCRREPPAYVQRDYSAIIYLNSEFKGGEIFFTHANLTVQGSLKPYQGMIVGFNAGNLHGVTAVEAGQRCAIALWFTLNPKFNEKAHLIARKVVDEMKEKENSKARDEL